MAISLTLTEGDDWRVPIDLAGPDGAPLDTTGMEFEARYAASPNLPARAFSVEKVDGGVILHLPREETSKLGGTTRLYFDVVAIANPEDPAIENHNTYVSGIINVRRGVGR